MGFLDRLLGRTPADDTRAPAPPRAPRQTTQQAAPHAGQQARTDDERALERYRYLLRTAPPETVEQAHEEAFAKLTPDQRRQVLTQLSAELPEAERARDDDPKSLARAATRAEVRQPGTLERAFGGRGAAMGGVGLGGIVAGSLMGSIAGAFIGTAIADSLFDGDGGGDDSADGGDGGDGADGGDGGSDGGGDGGYQDAGDAGDGGGYQDDLSAAGDTGGDFGGGDFGGGDFGGGDFGGGDF